MGNNYNDILVLLRNKIKRLIFLYEKSKEENKKITDENTELKRQIKLLTKNKEELTIKYNNLKLAKTLDASITDTHDAKLKVNKIVREIDKCIALLNK